MCPKKIVTSESNGHLSQILTLCKACGCVGGLYQTPVFVFAPELQPSKQNEKRML